MTEHACNAPSMLLTVDDLHAFADGQHALRLHAVWTKTDRPADDLEHLDDVMAECVHTYRARLSPDDDGALWFSTWRNVHGVWTENVITGVLHWHATLREVYDMIVAAVIAETEALIAAIPQITLPVLWSV